MASSEHPSFISKGEREWPGLGSSLLQGVRTPSHPKGCERWAEAPLHCASQTPASSAFSNSWVSAANWVDVFSNWFISPKLGNFENISSYPLLQPGSHPSHGFPSQVMLLSVRNKPVVTSGCWLWLFLPQHLGPSGPQHFSPKRENQAKAGNHPRKHWRYSLVGFSYT